MKSQLESETVTRPGVLKMQATPWLRLSVLMALLIVLPAAWFRVNAVLPNELKYGILFSLATFIAPLPVGILAGVRARNILHGAFWGALSTLVIHFVWRNIAYFYYDSDPYGEPLFALYHPIVGLTGGLIGAWLWRRKLLPPGNCVGCGYDLRGNASGKCPECGMMIGSGTRERAS